MLLLGLLMLLFRLTSPLLLLLSFLLEYIEEVSSSTNPEEVFESFFSLVEDLLKKVDQSDTFILNVQMPNNSQFNTWMM